MIVDMMSTHSSHNLESCLLRYYTVTKLILKYRYEQTHQLTLEEENIINYPYVLFLSTTWPDRVDQSLLKNRRMTYDRAFLLGNVNDQAEKNYLEQVQEIDEMLNRLSGLEPTEGYGPYDDLSAIPTVFKEDPVYVKPPPGVTLRSARFDNNVWFEY